MQILNRDVKILEGMQIRSLSAFSVTPIGELKMNRSRDSWSIVMPEFMGVLTDRIMGT